MKLTSFKPDLIPIFDERFDKSACKKLFETVEGNFKHSFDELLKTHFFQAEHCGKIFGGIFAYEKDGKTFVGGFSKRKYHKLNIEVMKEIISFYNCDLYAETEFKEAMFILKKIGFERIEENLFILRKGNQL